MKLSYVLLVLVGAAAGAAVVLLAPKMIGPGGWLGHNGTTSTTAQGSPSPSLAESASPQPAASESPGTSADANAVATVPPTEATLPPADANAPVPVMTDDQQKAADAEQARAHGEAGQLALGEIKGLIAAKEFERAGTLSRQALKDYFDTPVSKDLPDLVAQAEAGQAAKQDEDAREAAQREQADDAERQARHERFVKYRDQGLDAIGRKDFAAAAPLLQNALKEEEDPDTRVALDDAIDRTTKPRMGVPEFAAAGVDELPDAGKSVAEMLLTKFSQDKYQLIERTRIAAIMHERDLAISEIVDNPSLLKEKGVRDVKFLVLGSVRRMGAYVITARLVNVRTGEILQTGDVMCANQVDLPAALAELAAVLEMNADQKNAYLERMKLQRIRQAQAQRDFEEARIRERQRRQQDQELQLQHERDGAVALADCRALNARGDYGRARMLAWSAVSDYSDTQYARDLGEQLEIAERELAAIRQAQRLEQARRWDRHRQALDVLANIMALIGQRDYDQAVRLAHGAEQDYADTPAGPQFTIAITTAGRSRQTDIEALAQRRDRHEREAADRVIEVQRLIGKRDYDQAVTLSRGGAKDYADTPSGPQFRDLLDSAQAQAVAARANDAAKRQEHEQAAAKTLASMKALTGQRNYSAVVTLGDAAAKDYADTPSAEEIQSLYGSARKELDAIVQAARQSHQKEAADLLAMVKDLIAKGQYDKAISIAQPGATKYADLPGGKDLLDAIKNARQLGAAKDAAAAQKLQHEQEAAVTLAQIKAMMAKRNWAGATSAAQAAQAKYADTPSAGDIAAALKASLAAASVTPSATPAASVTPAPGATPTGSASPSHRPGMSGRPTPAATPEASPNATATASAAPAPSSSPRPSRSPRPTPAATPEASPNATAATTTEPAPSSSPRPSRSPRPTPAATAAGTPTPPPAVSPSPSAVGTARPAPSPAATPGPMATPKPAPSHSPTPTQAPSPSPAPTVKATPSPTPAPTANENVVREEHAQEALAHVKELSAKGSYAAAIVAGKQALKDFADTPSAKAIAEAIKEAQTAEAAQAARKKHEADAVDAVKDVHDLMDKHDYAQALKLATQAEKDYADTPSARELKALAKSCEAEIAAAHEAELKRKHQHDAQAALAEAKALFDKKDYAGAVAHAQAALKEYADTPVAKDLEALIAAAKAALATPTPTQAPASTPAATARPALRPAADANSAIAAVRALMIKKDYDTAAAQAKAAAKEFAGTPGGKELTFLRYQCEGLDAMSSKEYRTAVDAFTKALAEKDDADTRDLLKQATGLAKGGAK